MSTPVKYPVITICGSMRYYQLMLTAASELTERGWIVLMPFNASADDGTDLQKRLDDMHKRKIDKSEAIVIVGEHIGISTHSEILYASLSGKVVYSYLPAPTHPILQPYKMDKLKAEEK